MDLLTAALSYWERGWSIFPVDADKSPMVGRWSPYSIRHAPLKDVHHWFTIPNVAGIGLACGALSGVVVLDVERDGLSFFTGSMEPPRTLTAATQGGGMHFYYLYDRNVRQRPVASPDGLHVADIRSDGGYVVMPPSTGKSGDYTWIRRSDLAPPPRWLCHQHKLTREKSNVRTQKSLCGPSESGGYHSRSERIFGIGRSVLMRGGSYEDLVSACMDDPESASKLKELGHHRERYLRRTYEKLIETTVSNRPIVEASILKINRWMTSRGTRITLKLDTPMGVVHEGVTLVEGPRMAAFLRSCPRPEVGQRIRVELIRRSWEYSSRWRVRRWL